MSNLHKLCGLLNKDSQTQRVYYQVSILFPIPTCLDYLSQEGYGNFADPGLLDPFYKSITDHLDKTLDWYLSLHLLEAYKWLMREYHIGDKLLLFGTPPFNICCKVFMY
jgi:uncharacterized protein (DUF2235 family)